MVCHVIIILGLETQCTLQCKSVSTSLSKSYTQLGVRMVYLNCHNDTGDNVSGYCAMYVCVHLPIKILHTRTELEVWMVTRS